MIEVIATLLRLGIHKTDKIDAVLGMLEQLAANELPNVAGADDDGVLKICEP